MIIKAKNSEHSLALEILDESALFLKGKSINQWPYPTPTWERELVKSAISGGRVFFFHIAEQTGPIGVARLETEEEYLWTDRSPSAVYLHNFALAAGFHGRGIGKVFLSEIETWMGSMGKSVLRLNCHGKNLRLKDWYLDRGFSYLRDYSYQNWTTSLFEKTIPNKPEARAERARDNGIE